MKKIFNLLFVFFVGFLLVSCSDFTIKPKVEVEEIIITSVKSTILVNEELSLEVSVYPEEVNIYKLEFTSSDDNIVSVNSMGVVKGLSVGSATITANISSVKASILITVSDDILEIVEKPVENLNIGDIYQLKANKEVTWSSNDSKIVSVNETGLVKAHSAGSVVITATDNDVSISITITVNENILLITPINKLYEGMLPSVGNSELLVLMIQFSNDKFNSNDSNERIGNLFFGDDLEYHSVKSFYSESSFDNLELTGDVLPIYTAKYNSSYYEREYGDWASDALIQEALLYYDNTVDYSEFDSNDDGIIDNIVALYAKDYDYESDVWWAYNTNYEDPVEDDVPQLKLDNVFVNNYVWTSIEFLYDDDYLGNNIFTIVHELGHSFGLDDYYDYDEDIGPKGGLGGADLMDDTIGDHNAFSKYLLGWVDPIIIDLSRVSEHEYSVDSFVESGEFILITNDSSKGIFSEYIIIEYYTPTSLNESNYYFNSSGARLFHVDATLGTNDFGYYSKFKYDNSDTSKKIIKLIEADGRNDIENGRTIDQRIASDSDLFTNDTSYILDINKNFRVNFKIVNNKLEVILNKIN